MNAHIGAAPAVAMNSSIRMMLSQRLDPESFSLSDSGIKQDWEGLAELIGHDWNDIQYIKTKPSPTMHVLETWSRKSGSTIGQLWQFLEMMGQYAIIEDFNFRRGLEISVDNYNRRQDETRQAVSQPLQDPHVSEGIPMETDDNDEYGPDETREPAWPLVCGDVATGEVVKFDAFVCYNPRDDSDTRFMQQMRQQMEDVYNHKLCINARDLLVGSSDHTVTAKLIEERCNKMIIILSPSFLRSKACDFQLKFAHAICPGSRKKKLIPIWYKKCPIPSLLRHVAAVDYTRGDLMEWFWNRLSKSIQEPISRIDLNPDVPDADLNEIKYECQESIPFSSVQQPESNDEPVNHPSDLSRLHSLPSGEYSQSTDSPGELEEVYSRSRSSGSTAPVGGATSSPSHVASTSGSVGTSLTRCPSGASTSSMGSSTSGCPPLTSGSSLGSSSLSGCLPLTSTSASMGSSSSGSNLGLNEEPLEPQESQVAKKKKKGFFKRKQKNNEK